MINVYLGSVSVLVDIIILVLPMPVVFGLKLLVKSRVGLIALFLSGLLFVPPAQELPFLSTSSVLHVHYK